jgi:lipopolysaccharide biosynthesis glycosyltransferase
MKGRVLFPIINRNLNKIVASKKMPLDKNYEKDINLAPINVAFCFDENVAKQTRLSITSLLCNAGCCSYDIYCVVPKNFQQSSKSELENIAKKYDNSSSITFLKADTDFDQSFIWKAPAIYYRLMLPHLLPHLDKIIYADIDTMFCDNLKSADQIDLCSNLIAGVKDILNTSYMWEKEKNKFFKRLIIKNKYINSGFLIMNLKKMRKQNLYDQWVILSKDTGHRFPDQDILNYTCEGNKLLLPLKYNFVPQMYTRALLENIYSIEEYKEAMSSPVMIHYAGRAVRYLVALDQFIY